MSICYSLALTVPRSDVSDFSDWLGPGSRLPSDIMIHVKSIDASGKTLVERIPAHKAIIVKTFPMLEELFYQNKPLVREMVVKANFGESGIEAFRLFLFHVYGRRIKMEAIESYTVLANLVRFASTYRVEEVKTAAVARMSELVQHEKYFEVLTVLSTLAKKLNLLSLKILISSKIQIVITEELNTSVLDKFKGLKIAEEKDKIRILRDLSDLANNYNVVSLKSAIAAHMEAIIVTEDNFTGLVGMADSTQFMKPLRKILARYILAQFAYTEDLAYFLDSRPNLEFTNLFSILSQLHEKEEEE